ncbi:hypothetical protein ACWPKS_05980 [Coraliomargarita sp. W4R72]
MKLRTGAWTLLSIPEPKSKCCQSGQESPGSSQEDVILMDINGCESTDLDEHWRMQKNEKCAPQPTGKGAYKHP